MKRIAINGFGRIGRCVLRALNERAAEFNFEIVAINEPADLDTIAYLTRYDSTHGRFPSSVEKTDNGLEVNDRVIHVSHFQDIADLPWQQLDVDLVLECSGVYSSREEAKRHLQAGARRVLFSQPANADVDATIVYGVNDHELKATDMIVSNASCTTNGIVPVISCLQAAFGIRAGHITTLHSMMNDQPVIDAYHHTDLRKTRSASQSLIPVDTQLAKGIERILPTMTGRFSASAVRVPTTNVSAMELVVQLDQNVTREQVNAALSDASTRVLSGVLGFSTEPLASCDYNHDRRSGIVDGEQTAVIGDNLAKVFIWFDNEWGFANRMLEVSDKMLRFPQS
ncbi:MAG: type I glyceraldehyde-3-phosphate dehydrogenase [Pseudomonadales bacterium]